MVSRSKPNMKKLLSLGVLSLFIGMTTISGLTRSGSQAGGVNENIRDRFIGAWRLAWLEEEGADGKLAGRTAPGCLSIHTTATCRFR